ncbi:NADPH oxidase activator 1 isoform X2 [Dromaius novaehollandiae]|uniref:NADPH oxidase activator 1 isoform X2 n=1 Tax=Dromaius novaehollandiae TaxID=8790 RepID=UPI00311F7329
MAYRELVRSWHEGVRAADSRDWDGALRTFSSLEDPPSRICFNIGCVHLITGNLEQALQAFNKTVAKDNSLAVGFFQRGFVHLQLEMYEEALSDYRTAFTHLRKNPFIDYKQLGLRHILNAWEVLYSTAAAQCRLRQWQEARVTLEKAVVWRPEGRTAILDLALEQVQEHLFLEPMQVPPGEFFRPRKKEVEELDSKDFLGKPKKQGFYEPSADALRDCDSGYYRVLSHYYPEDSEKLAVKANSLVFVLTRGADDWATAIHDGQKLRIPASLLEPAPALKTDKWKISNGIPLPPAKVPPSRLHVKQKPESAEGENASANDDVSQMDSKIPPAREEALSSTDKPVVLRVHCDCTIALRAGEVPSLPDLRALLREKFSQQAEQGKLSYRHSDRKELVAVLGEEDLGKIWQQLADGRLTLWCEGSDSHSGRPVLYRMLAQHSYLAQGPGDLEFSKGDTLDILSEVNEDWLEGHCNGKTGIFPKCFATQSGCSTTSL